MSDEGKEMFRQLAIYSHVGITFVFSILVGFGMGWLLDNKVFNGRTAPYVTFIFLGLGIAAGFRQLWGLARKLKDD
ncbi:MAG: AtpZ/AtpI family protein [Desulfobulbus sp.]|jgi:F0F1-type ATP synthase assembly protein I|nr:AtpZ/AtpI family protein [Desulfobulbus sp.]